MVPFVSLVSLPRVYLENKHRGHKLKKNMADILCYKSRYRIDLKKTDIDPSLPPTEQFLPKFTFPLFRLLRLSGIYIYLWFLVILH